MSQATTKVFICYKKRLERAEAGKTFVTENTFAATIAEILNSTEGTFSAWLDEAAVPGGVEWENTIYTNLLDSDIVLLVLGSGTSESEWVKREITLAQAFGISVYPLGVGMTMDALMSELKALDIDHLQGKVSQNVRFNMRVALLAEIEGQLKEAAQRTAVAQAPILTKLLNRHAIPPPRKARDVQRSASFVLPHPDGTLALHVAAGDVAQVKGIDVLVSSENDYMQMARFFESRTVSSTLRLRGALLRGGRFDDTIQREIDSYLEGRARPLQPGECVATSAGGPLSDLVRFNEAKYIVHVAAVQTVIAEARVAPFYQPDQIVGCVRGVLLKIGDINRAQGIISPPGTDAYQLQVARAKDAYMPIKSAIFPLFGTGHGGGDKGEVIELMLNGLQDILGNRQYRGQLEGLTDIYFSAFLEPDVEQVTLALRRRFGNLAV